MPTCPHMLMHVSVHRHTKDAAVERSSITVILNKGEGCTVMEQTSKKGKETRKQIRAEEKKGKAEEKAVRSRSRSAWQISMALAHQGLRPIWRPRLISKPQIERTL